MRNSKVWKTSTKHRFFIGCSRFSKDRPYKTNAEFLRRCRKIVYKARRHDHNPPRRSKNLYILALEASLALFWEDLGASWALLGDCWALLGTLGHLLLAYCASLGRPWAFLGCLPSLFEASWAPLKRFGIDFGTFCGWFGRNLGGSGPQNNCFFKASPPLSLKPPNGLANRTSNFPASGLQSASAGRAKRKLF